jgi:hypothetical protein
VDSGRGERKRDLKKKKDDKPTKKERRFATQV